MWEDDAENGAFTHSTRDQLSVLSAKIEDNDGLMRLGRGTHVCAITLRRYKLLYLVLLVIFIIVLFIAPISWHADAFEVDGEARRLMLQPLLYDLQPG